MPVIRFLNGSILYNLSFFFFSGVKWAAGRTSSVQQVAVPVMFDVWPEVLQKSCRPVLTTFVLALIINTQMDVSVTYGCSTVVILSLSEGS